VSLYRNDKGKREGTGRTDEPEIRRLDFHRKKKATRPSGTARGGEGVSNASRYVGEKKKKKEGGLEEPRLPALSVYLTEKGGGESSCREGKRNVGALRPCEWAIQERTTFMKQPPRLPPPASPMEKEFDLASACPQQGEKREEREDQAVPGRGSRT